MKKLITAASTTQTSAATTPRACAAHAARLLTALLLLPGALLAQPVITQQPASLSVRVGDPATFSVIATGAPPLLYQWQFNATNLPNVTNSTFSLQTSALSNAGAYRVLVSNAGGTVTSAVATLTVTNPSCTPPLPAFSPSLDRRAAL